MPLALLGFVAVAVYLGQTVTLPPDLSEGALLVGHADRLAHGERVHFDLVEYYGPLAWELPVLSYRLAGSRVIGVHAYLALTRLGAVVATYLLVRRQVGRGPAALAALTATALLGMQWPFFNSPYAPHLALPVLLSSWLLLGRGPRAAAAAGVLTGVLLWLKISVGAFALAGGMLTEATLGGTGASPGRRGTAARLALIAAVCLVFHAFILHPFRAEYLAYFTLPLLLVGLSLGRGVLRASRGEGSAGDPRAAAAFLGGAAATWVVVLLAYFRPSEIAGYAREQLATFSRLDYAAPFPRLFVPGSFGNFTRMGWTLLPFGVTALHAAALRRAHRDGAAVDPRAARLATLSLLLSFVLHSRADEAHLFHAVVPSVPALFTLGGVHLERLGEAARARAGRWALAATVGAAATLLEPPSRDDYRLGPGDWSHPRLAGLRFHPPDYPYPTPKDRLQGGADAAIDDAARYLDALAGDGEEVLVLGPMQILVLASGTRAWGGRHVHDLWLLDRGVLSARAFREIVPPSFFERLSEDPPRVVVGELGEHRLVEALPELAGLLASGRYRMVGTRFRYLYFVLAEEG